MAAYGSLDAVILQRILQSELLSSMGPFEMNISDKRGGWIANVVSSYDILINSLKFFIRFPYYFESPRTKDPYKAFIGKETSQYYFVYRRVNTDWLPTYNKSRIVFIVPKSADVCRVMNKIDMTLFNVKQAIDMIDEYKAMLSDAKTYDKYIGRVLTLLKNNESNKDELEEAFDKLRASSAISVPGKFIQDGEIVFKNKNWQISINLYNAKFFLLLKEFIDNGEYRKMGIILEYI